MLWCYFLIFPPLLNVLRNIFYIRDERSDFPMATFLARHQLAPVAADLAPLTRQADDLASRAPALGLAQRLRHLRDLVPGRILLTTGFGLEAQAITHTIFENELPIDVVTLDTGRLFPETHAVWAATEARYGRRIRGISPDHEQVEAFVEREGIDGIRNSVAARRTCCHIRKVEPLGRALAGAAAWITGVRGDQSSTRAEMPYATVDATRALIKVNPLIDWSRDRVVDYVSAHRIPYNALHDRGFVSIGCAPCTRAVALGEPERAGRWWWEQESQKECGLHVASGAKPAPQSQARELADVES
jgi:phosphoadenosine phosphosulfate reductase